MSVTSGFFNSFSGDRKYNSRDISEFFDGLINDGIYPNVDNEFLVQEKSGVANTVTILSGRAWFNSIWLTNDSAWDCVGDPADTSYPRIDAVVIDVDKSSGVRAATIKFIKGTPSSNPVRPTLIRSDGSNDSDPHWQYPLCYIRRPANNNLITQSQITDVRGLDDCPFVKGMIGTTIDDRVLNTKEQIQASTDNTKIAGALGVKDIYRNVLGNSLRVRSYSSSYGEGLEICSPQYAGYNN